MIPSSLAFVMPGWDREATFSLQVRRASAWPESRLEQYVERLNPPESAYVAVAVLLLTLPFRAVHLVRHWPGRRTWLLLVYRGIVTTHRPDEAMEHWTCPTKHLAQQALRRKAMELAKSSDPPARVMYS